MFLALDESIGSQFTTIGCLCLPRTDLPGLESAFIDGRLTHKMWGELKWSKISRAYCNRYKDIITKYLQHSDVTFHSWTYRIPSATERKEYYEGIPAENVIYRHAYLLIRSVIWKCRNNGYQGPYYVLADETGKLGQREYSTTQSLLRADSRISPAAQFDFCTTGNSISCGAMQVSDLCTGAIMSYYDNGYSAQDSCQEIVDLLKSFNHDVELNISPSKLPALKSLKLHHYLLNH